MWFKDIFCVYDAWGDFSAEEHIIRESKQISWAIKKSDLRYTRKKVINNIPSRNNRIVRNYFMVSGYYCLKYND